MNINLRSGFFELVESEPLVLLSHMTFYGLASIVEAETSIELRLSWSRGMTPRPLLSGAGVSEDALGRTVKSHAQRRAGEGAWPAVNSPPLRTAGPAIRGIMSPRIGKVEDWGGLQRQRHSVLNDLTEDRATLDLRLLWSLGEPCYWRLYRKGQGEAGQDDASSRLDMQPRNSGANIVFNRFAPLARLVGERSLDAIISGLRGEVTDDRCGNNKLDSHSGVGFSRLGPVDDVVAWCALWGISQFPLTLRALYPAITGGYLTFQGADHCYTPLWKGAWTPSRLRTILASSHLRAFATGCVGKKAADITLDASTRWLAARGVQAVVTFPIVSSGGQYPSRHAERGVLHRVGTRV